MKNKRKLRFIAVLLAIPSLAILLSGMVTLLIAFFSNISAGNDPLFLTIWKYSCFIILPLLYIGFAVHNIKCDKRCAQLGKLWNIPPNMVYLGLFILKIINEERSTGRKLEQWSCATFLEEWRSRAKKFGIKIDKEYEVILGRVA
jgi:hypothetical protein